jgi:hypothetical protein
MGPAFAAKLTRHWAFEIGTREFARFAACVAKALRRHEHEYVWRATADVLAFAAMALCLESRFAFCHVANFSAVTPAFEFHGENPPNKVILARNGKIAEGPRHAACRGCLQSAPSGHDKGFRDVRFQG